LSGFGVGGRWLVVKQIGQSTVFEVFPFVFNGFTEVAGVVAAAETVVLAVKTNQPTAQITSAPAKITHPMVEAVVAMVAGTSAIAQTIRATVKTISSAVAKVVAAFPTSSPGIQIISANDFRFVLGSATVPVAVVGVAPTTSVSRMYLAGRQIPHARRARSPIQN